MQLNNGIVKGIVNVNLQYNFKEKSERPIERNGQRQILSIGRVNYALLDTFIMASLNDYYAKINTTKKEEERAAIITEYNTLYGLWYRVNEAKRTQDSNLNSYYDDIVYRLYLLGYHN